MCVNSPLNMHMCFKGTSCFSVLKNWLYLLPDRLLNYVLFGGTFKFNSCTSDVTSYEKVEVRPLAQGGPNWGLDPLAVNSRPGQSSCPWVVIDLV